MAWAAWALAYRNLFSTHHPVHVKRAWGPLPAKLKNWKWLLPFWNDMYRVIPYRRTTSPVFFGMLDASIWTKKYQIWHVHAFFSVYATMPFDDETMPDTITGLLCNKTWAFVVIQQSRKHMLNGMDERKLPSAGELATWGVNAKDSV